MYPLFKRLLDIIISASALTLLSPVFLIVYIKVKRNLGSPVIFTQPRPGLNGKVFNMYKFRSMKNATDAQGNPLPDEQRMTPFSHKLRNSSADELPGLWNVLKGNMSLVGPRPLLVEYLPLYNERQAKRHDVKPGITGWAQVNGRNTLTWEEKFEYDVWYVENMSLWLDIKILFLTVKKVFIKEGISAQGEVTMPKFTGSQPQ
ncbi:sugar transferase [Thalassotalea sp. LPB0316]|uniref:sugar transferase n=1 Tax=Thalassotalea sp. LPB0316 TaxID=2769490 RepID=UPI0018681DF9|nr:sugar transferase [Thalassotalea sp. LPB0316]QOL26570.1 sugar transferase [Thalassotalea sp. LPB0316]